MKNFLAIIYFVILLVNVFSPAHCHELEIQNSQGQISFVSANSVSDSQDSDDTHHSGHVCHLGHCSFVISNQEPLLYKNIIFSFQEAEYYFILSDFKNNLFRPPIS